MISQSSVPPATAPAATAPPATTPAATAPAATAPAATASPKDPSKITVVLQWVGLFVRLLLDNIATLIGLVMAWSWYRQGRTSALLYIVPVASSLVLMLSMAMIGMVTLVGRFV